MKPQLRKKMCGFGMAQEAWRYHFQTTQNTSARNNFNIFYEKWNWLENEWKLFCIKEMEFSLSGTRVPPRSEFRIPYIDNLISIDFFYCGNFRHSLFLWRNFILCASMTLQMQVPIRRMFMNWRNVNVGLCVFIIHIL